MGKRICVVGAGRWGKNHIRALAGLGCLSGIVEPDEHARSVMIDAYPQARVFRALQDALEEDFDGKEKGTEN